MTKHYYQLCLTQLAPLRIGSGENDNTDSDLMMDGRGLPFLPGSSLAGALRSRLAPQTAERLFGKIDISTGVIQESRVMVSDAVLPADADPRRVYLTRRDGVGIGKNGAARPGAKFDFEVAETTLPYTAVLEMDGDDEAALLEPLMQAVAADGLTLGARTSRGYGHMQGQVRHRAFAFPAELTEWLAFDPFAPDAFAEVPVLAGAATGTGLTIRAQLAFAGSFSVRVYTSAVSEEADTAVPKYAPLRSADGQVVIPGTSWAGSLRHHMQGLLAQLQASASEQAELDRLFGVVPESEPPRRSALYFSETRVEGGHCYNYTRNAVERFTAAPRNQALYTSQLCRDGTGVLEICIPGAPLPPLYRQLLAAALIDLDLGLLTFGGESGVGRGLARVQALTVNGRDCTERLKKQDTGFLEGESE